MAINFSSKNYVDNVIEVTALKSKILLTENEIIKLSEYNHSLSNLVYLINEPEHYLRVHYDEIDSTILQLRKSIGNIPDTRVLPARYDFHYLPREITSPGLKT